MYPLIAVTRHFVQCNCRPARLQGNCQMQNLVLNQWPQQMQLTRLHNRIFSWRIKKPQVLLKKSPIFLLLFDHIPRFLRNNSVCVVKNCVEQFEFVLAYRIRRGLQVLTLYSRLWDDHSFRKLLQRIKKIALNRSRDLLIASAVFQFNWDNERITDDELFSHFNELDYCHTLRETIPPLANSKKEGCNCALGPSENNEEACWVPFVKEADMTCWRQETFKGSGVFCYKMYRRFPDVTANDFLQVFLDIENRKEWDSHAIKLQLIESEPSTNSDVIYWETKWPKFFNNRDYVYKRRYIVDSKRKIMVVKNKSTTHPSVPLMPNKSRVSEYWSYAVIKPFTNFSEPGIEFSLTYFDNPGVSLPTSITLWVTLTGMPQYLNRLRMEAKRRADERQLRNEIDRGEWERLAKELKGDRLDEIKDMGLNADDQEGMLDLKEDKEENEEENEESKPKEEPEKNKDDPPPSPPSGNNTKDCDDEFLFFHFFCSNLFMEKLRNLFPGVNQA